MIMPVEEVSDGKQSKEGRFLWRFRLLLHIGNLVAVKCLLLHLIAQTRHDFFIRIIAYNRALSIIFIEHLIPFFAHTVQ